MEIQAPPPESTPMWEMIQFTRALALVTREAADHPIHGQLNDLEESLHVLEHLYRNSDDFVDEAWA